MLEISNLNKSFGGLQAITNLSLNVEEGEIISVIGPNGAGKTTFFNLITGVYKPDSGDIRFEDQVYRRTLTQQDCRPGRGSHLPESTALHQPLGLG